jgi:response regulator RpfG family c-di-GMP phosphodiesterase
MLLEAMAPRISYLLRKHADHQMAAQKFAAIQESLRATTTVGHLRQDHVTAVCREICLATARRIKLPPEEMEHLAFALQFYDVGMSYVPAHLVHRPGPLGPDERLEITEHVPLGLAVLAPLQPPSKVRQIILHHHENFDGTGYPDGLEGEAIPLGARLLRLADCFGALVQSRSYREAYGYDDAVAQICGRIGKDFCPRLSEAFLAEVQARRERLMLVTDANRDDAALACPIVLDSVIPVRA